MARDLGLSPGARGRAFFRGLRSQHPLIALGGAALVAALLAALTVWVDRGGFIALPEDRLLRIENDDYVHVTYTLATLRKSPPGERTAYYFGGSGAMDCIVGGPSLGAAVATAGGGELPVISLAAHAQSLGQTLALVECLPDTPAVLLVGLAPMRFTTAPGEDARLLTGRPMPIRSERLASVLGERYDLRPSAIAPLPGILDYIAGYFRARHEGDRGWLTSLAYDPHYQGDRVFKTAVMKRREAAGAIARDRQEYAAHGSYNVAVLEELLALAGERGHAVVLFDQPLNVGVAEETWGGVIPAYRREVRRLAATYDAVYIDSGAWRLPDAAFGDVYHLVPSARRSWEAAFARALAPALRTATGSAPAP